jgi:hypothetical protein
MKDLSHYIKMQLMEIYEHQWYLGERLNRPVSEQEAIQDWITSGHAERFNICYTRNEDEIERTIQESGLVPVLQDKSKLHGLLKD